jgi:hypothetical protein
MIDFRKYKTEKELVEATGLSLEQALRIINAEIEELKAELKW